MSPTAGMGKIMVKLTDDEVERVERLINSKAGKRALERELTLILGIDAARTLVAAMERGDELDLVVE